MRTKPWKIYTISIMFTEAVGALSGWLTRDGMKYFSEQIAQPPLSPPSFLFPIVWGILYALLGIGAARIWMAPPSDDRSKGLGIYIIQLIVNFFWSLIFFNMQQFGFAFIWLLLLWALVAWMIIVFRKTDRLAAWVQLPYLLWLTFAAYLNLGVWYLNR